jgi:hypothetical protein
VDRTRASARHGRVNGAWRAVIVVAVAVGLSACGVGTWETSSTPSPVRGIHVAVLPTGKVLLVAGSGNDRDAFDAGTFETSSWDPATNTFTAIATPWDAFCAGHAQLGDGRLLVAGGTNGYESAATNNTFSGSRRAYVFDATTERYESVPNMTTARWYPSLLTLGDGSVLAVAGQGSDGRLTSTWQRFAGGTWTTDQQPPVRDDLTPGARMSWPMYPGLHLLDDGRVFFSSTHTFGLSMPPGTWDLATNRMHGVAGLSDRAHTDHAMSVLLPPAQDQKVMLIGGGRDDGSLSTNRTAVVDFKQPDPRYVDAAPLDAPKMYTSAVILPDRTVFETGGAQRQRSYGNSYVQSSQIYDPRTGTWTKAKDATVPRGYHSSAVLLPDGRVATFGNNPSDGSFELRIELYSPDYLTKGERPRITQVATDVTYGGSYAMTTAPGTPIRDVSLVRPMAVTHSDDGNQRLVDVPFTTNPDGSLQLSVTDNPNLAPPGWYMLFATDTNGVPSVASWVKVGHVPGNPAPVEGAPRMVAPAPSPVQNPPSIGVRGG